MKLPDVIAGWRVEEQFALDSTNAEARRRAAAGLREKTLFCAHTQTAGRGRLNRRWVSPAGAGLWMTLLAFPRNVPASDAGGAVFLSALALCETIREMTGADAGIKWPNDLVLGGKKICGMLAECGMEGDFCGWVALGVGLNLKKDALPGDLVYASSIEEQTGLLLRPEEVLGRFLPRFDALMALWEGEGLSPVLKRLKPLCVTLGREVRIDGVHAVALDLGEGGELLARMDSGEVRRVLCGDVSVRGMTDYV